jgi:hypothetical protein
MPNLARKNIAGCALGLLHVDGNDSGCPFAFDRRRSDLDGVYPEAAPIRSESELPSPITLRGQGAEAHQRWEVAIGPGPGDLLPEGLEGWVLVCGADTSRAENRE